MNLYEEELKRMGYTLLSEATPPPNQPVFVATPKFRCLGVLTREGKWVSNDTREPLQDVAAWAPWPQPTS